MILNLTQHPATPEQVESGVVDLVGVELLALKGVLTFDAIPDPDEISARAEYIAKLAQDKGPICTNAMIGGAPYLMSALEKALRAVGITPLYAFSRRESVEQAQEDGSVKKVNVFRHVGFVEGM